MSAPAALLPQRRPFDEPVPAGNRAGLRAETESRPPALPEPAGTDDDLWPWVALPGGGLELRSEAA